jgi:hypothetical protein
MCKFNSSLLLLIIQLTEGDLFYEAPQSKLVSCYLYRPSLLLFHINHIAHFFILIS